MDDNWDLRIDDEKQWSNPGESSLCRRADGVIASPCTRWYTVSSICINKSSNKIKNEILLKLEQ